MVEANFHSHMHRTGKSHAYHMDITCTEYGHHNNVHPPFKVKTIDAHLYLCLSRYK